MIQTLESLKPSQLVDLLAYKANRNEVVRTLVGGLTATEFRRITLSDEVLAALLNGLGHSNPKVRWWCLQLIDHLGDENCIEAVSRLLDDNVPRVRKMAIHTLFCETCKNSRWCTINPQIVTRLKTLAQYDENTGVREAAREALTILQKSTSPS
jgi:HEAT repeat protein